MEILENTDLGNASGRTGEIVVYQPDDITRLEVRLKDETVWLNRQQIAQLFGRDVKTIGKHINNALNEELSDIPTVANFATTATDGKTYKTGFYKGMIYQFTQNGLPPDCHAERSEASVTDSSLTLSNRQSR